MKRSNIFYITIAITVFMEVTRKGKTEGTISSRLMSSDILDRTKDPAPSVVTIEGEERNICLGVIIDKYWIVTTARCLGFKTEVYDVRIGSDKRVGGRIYKIDKIIFHRKYAIDKESGIPFFDIALAKMKEEIQFSEYVKAAKIVYYEPLSLAEVSIVGFQGETFAEKFQTTLVIKNVSVVTYECCEIGYAPAKLANHMMCAAAPGNYQCWGDLGGPMVDANHPEYLIGILSWGNVLCVDPFGHSPPIYTSIGFFAQWIDDIKQKN